MSINRLRRILSGSKIGRIIKKDTLRKLKHYEILVKISDMSRSELIKFLEEEVRYLYVTSEWVKENFHSLFVKFMGDLRIMVRGGKYITDWDDVDDFEKGEWVICLVFKKQIAFSAGRDKQEAERERNVVEGQWGTWNYNGIDTEILRNLAVQGIKSPESSGLRR